MAVTVEHAPSVVLDDDYRVVGLNDAARPWLEEHVGRVLFECFPGSEPVFRPYWERARESGETVEFAEYFAGYLVDVRAEPGPRGLSVSWTTLASIDTTTLGGLQASLENVLERLEHAERSRLGARPALRVLPGEGGGGESSGVSRRARGARARSRPRPS